MSLKDQPIQRKLKAVILLTSSAVLLLTCAAFVTYEWISFRHETVQNLSALAEITAANSTAALAFENENDAKGVLSSLKVQRHIVAAALYGKDGNLFARYPTNEPVNVFLGPPYPDYEQHLDALKWLVEALKQKLTAESVMILQSDREIPHDLVKDDESWDVRHYGRTQLAIWLKVPSHAEEVTAPAPRSQSKST